MHDDLGEEGKAESNRPPARTPAHGRVGVPEWYGQALTHWRYAQVVMRRRIAEWTVGHYVACSDMICVQNLEYSCNSESVLESTVSSTCRVKETGKQKRRKQG